MTQLQERVRRCAVAIPHRFFAGVLAASLLFITVYFLSGVLNTVSVTDSEGSSHSVITWQTDPTQLLKLAGVTVGEHDRVYYTSYQSGRQVLHVQRAFPVYVQVDGGQQQLTLCSGTVEEVLGQCGIVLGEHDYTEPSLNTQVAKDDVITVHRVEYQDTVVYESIPYETEYVYTSSFFRSRNRTEVMQEGREGTNEITHRQRVVDGEVESSQVVSVVQTVAPRNTIIRAYQKGAPVSSLEGPELLNGAPSSYRAVYTGRATGYTASRGRGASGLGLYYGTVAVNPNQIPYGSKLYITSTDGRLVYGYAIATDTGGAMLNGSVLVDLFMETYYEAAAVGSMQVNVYVI